MSPTSGHSIELQGKYWGLVPKDLLIPGQAFDPAKGMRGRNPTIRFLNGSVIHFRTWGNASGGGDRAAMAVSGGTFDHWHVDELCPPRVLSELKKRVERRNGTIRMAVTPINSPALAAWVQKECAEGRIKDMPYRCEARWCIPVGSTEPLRDAKTGIPMDQAWIDRLIAATDPDELDVVVHGGWQVVHRDRSFGAWDEALIIRDESETYRATPIPKTDEVLIGIDYGEAPGRLVIELMIRSGPEIWVLSEWCGEGGETPLEIAQATVKMLRDWGLELKHVSNLVGDVNSAGVHGAGQKMNELVQEILRQLGAPKLEIETAFKTRGSVDERFTLMNWAMAQGRLHIHESCARLLESVRTHRKSLINAAYLKDPIDAVWYAAADTFRAARPTPMRVQQR
jgi:hypothetical protein